MKKIAFFVQWMICGGIENSLIALTKELVKKGNFVTIYVIKRKGKFIDRIPEGVILKEIPMPESVRSKIPVGGTKVTVRECLAKGKMLSAVYFVVRHEFNKCEFAELNINKEKIPNLDEKYDIVVNYQMHSPFLIWYISEKISAKQKFAWIHNDFTSTKYNIKTLNQYLKCVNHFFAVSKQVENEFTYILPQYKEITHIAHNLIPINDIKELAQTFIPEEYQNTTDTIILSVGRLEEQKGFDIAIIACSLLKKKGKNIQWFVVGDGTQKRDLENEIRKYGLEDSFHLLGMKVNPYPYFANCDIYVQPSRHEGWGITLTEAKIFNKVVVTTNFAGAQEQIKDGVTGDIVKVDPSAISSRIERLIEEPERYMLYVNNLKKEELDNTIDNECFTFFE